jgi:hypothetical protein
MGQRLLLSTVLATGFLVVWFLVALWAAAVSSYDVNPEARVEQLCFLADGTPCVAAITDRHADRQYHDLEGNPLTPPEADDHAGWLNPRPLAGSLSAKASDDFSWGLRVRSFADGRAPAGYWYFMSDGCPDGSGYFVGYDSESRACIGYLGAAGFRAEPLPAEELIPFSGETSGLQARVFCTQRDHSPTEHPLNRSGGRAPRGSVSAWDVYVLGRDQKVYHADLNHRTVQVAFEDPRLRSAGLIFGPPDPVRGTPNRLAVRMDDAVLVLDERGHLLERYTIPHELRERGFALAQTTTGEAVMDWSSSGDSLATTIDHHIYRVTPDGRHQEARVSLRWAGSMRRIQVLGGFVAPAPLVLGGWVAIGRTSDLINEELEATYAAALRRAFTEFWPALLLAQVIALGLAVLCYRRQLRYGATAAERVIWPLFVLVLGLPGWAGYRFGRSWPVLEACSACEVAVPRDRVDCVRCAATFPGPALKGTEVFA